MHAAAIKKSNTLELTAIVDFNEDIGKKAAARFGVKYYKDTGEMLEAGSFDIADICLPTFLHEQYVLLMAEHKKHVLCEKPFALSSESAGRMAGSCECAGVKFMIAQTLRWKPDLLKIKEYLENGVFGVIHLVSCSRLAQHPNWTTWHRDVKKSGGGLFDLHVHDIDYLYFLFGEVEEVYATGWKSPTGCWNHVISILKFKNGMNAVAEGSFEMTGDFPFSVSYRLTGDKSTVDYRLTAGFNIENTESVNSRLMLFEKDQPPVEVKTDPVDSYQLEIEAFAQAVENDKDVPILPEDSVYVIKIIEALQLSLESGAVVKIQ
jgi:predicted dehydrogenase